MSKDTPDSRWLDERYSESRPGLTCHVELEIESGDTFRDNIAEAVRALRATAVSLEAGEFDEGFHPIKTLDGEKIGEVYIDYYETM